MIGKPKVQNMIEVKLNGGFNFMDFQISHKWEVVMNLKPSVEASTDSLSAYRFQDLIWMSFYPGIQFE